MANANAGLAAIKEMIARLRAIKELPKNIAPAIAREMKAWADANVSAGVGPDGKAWPTRADGSPSHVGSALADTSARASGTVAILRLAAPTVFRHFGAQGREPREVLPGNFPRKLGDAIRLSALEGWESLVKRGKR